MMMMMMMTIFQNCLLKAFLRGFLGRVILIADDHLEHWFWTPLHSHCRWSLRHWFLDSNPVRELFLENLGTYIHGRRHQLEIVDASFLHTFELLGCGWSAKIINWCLMNEWMHATVDLVSWKMLQRGRKQLRESIQWAVKWGFLGLFKTEFGYL